MCLSQKELDVSIPGKGQVRPFMFGTDTTLGMKIAWSGMTAQMPDTVRLGFNRKEFALAPLFVSESLPCVLPGSNQHSSYSVDISSFVAVLDNENSLGLPRDTGFKWRQYIATGASATSLASQKEFRDLFMERVDPDAFPEVIYDINDPKAVCLDEWLKDAGHRKELADWWREKGYRGTAGIQITGSSQTQRERRKAFIEKKEICTNK
jgi:hypothetical protein